MASQPNELATSDDFEFAALQAAENYRLALIKEFGPYLRGRVLEIGAGVGQMTQLLLRQPAVREVVPVEPSDAFIEQLRAAVPCRKIIHGTADDLGEDRDWNAILSVNVLEHIEHDQEELVKYRSLLAGKAGHLCLFVPARPEIYAPLDRDFGHFRRYRKPELKARLEQAGFSIRSLSYYNIVGYLGWWWTFRVRKRRSFDVNTVRFFDRVIFPWVHGFETTIMRPPIGQSLIAVAQAV